MSPGPTWRRMSDGEAADRAIWHPLRSPQLNPPGAFLRRMLVFLALVGFLVAIIYQQLATPSGTTPASTA